MVALIELGVSRLMGKLRSNRLLTPKVDIFNVDDMIFFCCLISNITPMHINSNTPVETQVAAYQEGGEREIER